MNFSLNAIKFEDVRSQIIEVLKSNSEFSGQFDFTASNIGLIVDSMAYVSMLMAYQISNVSNNLFLDTTTLRKNAVSIAKTMGYRPIRAISSKIYGTVEYVSDVELSADAVIKIPANTIFPSDSGYNFINTSEIVLTRDSINTKLLKSDLTLTEGEYREYVYLGNGKPHQTFTIPSKKVEENNFTLYVYKNNNVDTSSPWSEVKKSFNLLSKNSYFLEEDLNSQGYVKVVFGEGTISNYPQSDEIVKVTYLETNGTLATGSKILSLPFDVMTSENISGGIDTTKFKDITVTSGASYGAKEIETLPEIQFNAPQSFAAAGRAVTKYDYETLLNQESIVYKSNVIGGDTLYPENPDKLGNIYITAIPYYDINNILTDDVKIYINNSEKNQILTRIDKYRIISTKINLINPSYVYVNISPTAEVRSDVTPLEKVDVANNVKSTLVQYNIDYFNDFETSMRAAKLNSVASKVNNVLSSDYTADYSLILTKESFSENDPESIFYLPVMVETKDSYGVVLSYSNFVKTNQEQKQILNVETLNPDQTTIYGVIQNDQNVERVLYSEDIVDQESGLVITANIKLDGKNELFNFTRVDDNVGNTDPNPKLVTATISAISTSAEQYQLSYNDKVFGYVKRTNSQDNGFLGKLKTQGEITANPSHGNFYHVVVSMELSGSKYKNTYINAFVDDYLMYDADNEYWFKCSFKNDITAFDDSQLYDLITDNVSYAVSGVAPSGDFQGIVQTPLVSGDWILFNRTKNTGVENPYHWYKVNFTNNSLSAGNPLPSDVEDYVIKKVINLEVGQQTHFGSQTTSAFYDNDIIFYNPNVTGSEADKWQLIINSQSVTSIPISATISADADLDTLFDYMTTPQIGDYFRVEGIGNFGTGYSTVNWPTSEEIAYDNDVLLYIGDGKWNIWQDGVDVFNIDGNIPSSLPIKLNFADAYIVTGNGTFYDYFATELSAGEFVAYAGTKVNDYGQTVPDWFKLERQSKILNYELSANLPEEAELGSMYRITVDGDFNNSPLVAAKYDNDEFVQGDYLIYNGSKYTCRNEYTFVYLDTIVDYVGNSKTFINNVMNLNSVFRYVYQAGNNTYYMYFDDIYNGAIIGEFAYDSSTLNNVGMLTINSNITGFYNYNETTDPTHIRNLFNTKKNRIKFLPKNKKDANGNLTTENETNFNTNFNTFVTLNINDVDIQL